MVIFEDLEIGMAVTSSGMDFKTLVEVGYQQPIAFKDFDALQGWLKNEFHNAEITKVGRRKLQNVILITGLIKVGQELREYEQVWVRATYKSYRRAMMQYYQTKFRGRHLKRYDIDHSVARKTLKSWSNAWVNILYVDSGINRSIGGLMERYSSMNIKHSDRIFFNAECLLKLFYEKKSKLHRSEIEKYIKETKEVFLITEDQGATKEEITNVNLFYKNILEIYHP